MCAKNSAHATPQMVLPDAARINRILSDAVVGYQLNPPMLVATRVHIAISVPEAPPSLAAQAPAVINQALEASEWALSEVNGRASRVPVEADNSD